MTGQRDAAWLGAVRDEVEWRTGCVPLLVNSGVSESKSDPDAMSDGCTRSAREVTALSCFGRQRWLAAARSARRFIQTPRTGR